MCGQGNDSVRICSMDDFQSPRHDCIVRQRDIVLWRKGDHSVVGQHYRQFGGVMALGKINRVEGRPWFQLFLDALLRMKTHGVERTVLSDGERSKAFLRSLSALSIHWRTTSIRSGHALIEDFPFLRSSSDDGSDALLKSVHLLRGHNDDIFRAPHAAQRT